MFGPKKGKRGVVSEKFRQWRWETQAVGSKLVTLWHFKMKSQLQRKVVCGRDGHYTAFHPAI